MAIQRFSRRTKQVAIVFLLPIPYLAFAISMYAILKMTLSPATVEGSRFQSWMWVLFDLVPTALVFVSLFVFVPLVASLITDWHSYRNSKRSLKASQA
jgi:hypothetical protein